MNSITQSILDSFSTIPVHNGLPLSCYENIPTQEYNDHKHSFISGECNICKHENVLGQYCNGCSKFGCGQHIGYVNSGWYHKFCAGIGKGNK